MRSVQLMAQFTSVRFTTKLLKHLKTFFTPFTVEEICLLRAENLSQKRDFLLCDWCERCHKLICRECRTFINVNL